MHCLSEMKMLKLGETLRPLSLSLSLCPVSVLCITHTLSGVCESLVYSCSSQRPSAPVSKEKCFSPSLKTSCRSVPLQPLVCIHAQTLLTRHMQATESLTA